MSIVLESPAGVGADNFFKRKGSDDEDELSSKRARYSYYVTLESESPIPTSEDDESIYTVQGNETEFVQDTSDTSTHSWENSSDDDDVSVRLEFEVASHSEEENPMLNGTSSSDPEDFVTMGVIAALCNETDIGYADDSDDSLCTLDSEIGRADYWTCVQCSSKNNNPLFRYCEKCYQIRKNFFPPRPKRRKRRQRADKEVTPENIKLPDSGTSYDSGLGSQDLKSNLDSKASEETVSSPDSKSSQDTESSPDSKLSQDTESVPDSKVSQDSQSSPVLKLSQDNQLNVDSQLSQDSKLSQDAQFVDSIKLELSQDTKSSQDLGTDSQEAHQDTDSDNKMCIMCTLNPKNGAFSHGSILHICCCYKCAVRIWRTNKHCPICNRKITNVQKVFYN